LIKKWFGKRERGGKGGTEPKKARVEEDKRRLLEEKKEGALRGLTALENRGEGLFEEKSSAEMGRGRMSPEDLR